MADKFKMWVHRGDKHNKFWTYDITNAIFSATYGRIGTDGVTKPKPFGSQYSAESHADKKIHEKERKGYNKVSEDEFKMLTVCAQAIGATNKVEKMALVLDDGQYLFEIKPESAFDPSLEPSILLSFRLRDKHGATEPYWMLLDGDSAYDLGYARPYRQAVKMKKIVAKHATAVYKPQRRTKITNSHELAPVVEKAEAAIGHGLL